MKLSNEDIKRYLKDKVIEITPYPKDEQIGPASVDLTLSNEFYLYEKKEIRKVQDLSKVSSNDITRELRADSIRLKPRDLILGKTVEKIKLPNFIIGILEGRSRYARMGLAVHVTSALVQPGSDNHQVLEIFNLAPFSIVLHAGMRISQVTFEKLETGTSKPYSKYGTVAVKQ